MQIVGVYAPGSTNDVGTISTHTIKKQNVKKIVLTLLRPDILNDIFTRICARHITRTPIICIGEYIRSTPLEIQLPKSADILLEFSGPSIKQALPTNGIYKVQNAVKAELYDINNNLIDTEYIDAYLATPAIDILAYGTYGRYSKLDYTLYRIYDETIAVTEKFCIYYDAGSATWHQALPDTNFSLSGYDVNPLENYVDPKEVIIGRGIVCIKPYKYILATAIGTDIAIDYYWTYQIGYNRIIGKTPQIYTAIL